jgi:CheY-like chemotaxis protein
MLLPWVVRSRIIKDECPVGARKPRGDAEDFAFELGAIIDMKVLIIDDYPIFASELEGVFHGMGLGIVAETASTIDAALERIETAPDLDLILLDLSFPGLVGFSLLRVLDQRNCLPPVIVVSARADPEVMSACIDAGAVGFIPKVHSAPRMREAIKAVLAGGNLPANRTGSFTGPPSLGWRRGERAAARLSGTGHQR